MESTDNTLGSWQPLHPTAKVHDLSVSWWEEPRLPGEPSFDQVLVLPTRNGVRLAVFDPAVVTDRPQSTAAALALVGVVASSLRAPQSAAEILVPLARRLVPPRPYEQPTLSLAVVDWDRRTGTIEAWRYGDAEVYLLQKSGGVDDLFPTDVLTKEARAAYEDRDPHASTWDFHREFLHEPRSWNCPPLGLFSSRPEHAHRVANDGTLVVATDGPRFALDQNRLRRLEEWLATGLQSREFTAPDVAAHGDVACVWASVQ